MPLENKTSSLVVVVIHILGFLKIQESKTRSIVIWFHFHEFFWVKIFLEYYDVQLWCQIEKNTQDYNYFTILFTVTIQKFALQMWLVTKLNLFLEQLQNLLWITVIQIALEFQNLWIILEKFKFWRKIMNEEKISSNCLSKPIPTYAF